MIDIPLNKAAITLSFSDNINEKLRHTDSTRIRNLFTRPLSASRTGYFLWQEVDGEQKNSINDRINSNYNNNNKKGLNV